MTRALVVSTLLVLCLVWQPANACKVLVRFPDHLDFNREVSSRSYVVEIIAHHDKGYVGRVKQSFGGVFEVDKPVVVRFVENEEAHAICPITIAPGSTYLLIGAQPDTDLVISKFNWLNVPSTHERFSTYVHDLESGP